MDIFPVLDWNAGWRLFQGEQHVVVLTRNETCPSLEDGAELTAPQRVGTHLGELLPSLPSRRG